MMVTHTFGSASLTSDDFWILQVRAHEKFEARSVDADDPVNVQIDHDRIFGIGLAPQ